MSDLLQSLPTFDNSHLCRSRFWQQCPFLEGNPNLLLYTFPDGFVCNLLQVDQLVPSIKSICKMVREMSEGFPSQGSLRQLEQQAVSGGQSRLMHWSEGKQTADGKALLMHPFISPQKQMPKDTVEFLLWERSQFDLANLLGIFCGK